MSGDRPDAFLPLFVADYLADTTHLERHEHGAYLLLLMAYWRKGGPLPSDDLKLCRIAKATPSEWKKLKPVMLEFFHEDNGLWVNKRAEIEIEKATQRLAARSKAGKIGANARWQPHSNRIPVPLANTMTDPMTKNGSSPSPTHKKENKDMSAFADVDPDFLKFWKAYPRNQNMSRKDALQSWTKLKRAGSLPAVEQLLRAVAGYKSFIDRETRKQGKPYPAKHAQGWLSGQRWEAYLESETLITIAATDWADANPKWAKFKSGIPPAAWQSFFSQCSATDESLTAPTAFVRDQIEARYGQALDAMFGPNFRVILQPALKGVA